MKNFVVICALSFALAACLGGGGGSGDGGSSGGGTTPTTPSTPQSLPGIGTPGGVSAVPPQGE